MRIDCDAGDFVLLEMDGGDDFAGVVKDGWGDAEADVVKDGEGTLKRTY
jgi:hypothetical protein